MGKDSEKWIDEAYFEDGKKREIQSVLDAVAICIEHKYCNVCAKCGIRMYEDTKGSGCPAVVKEAREFILNYVKENRLEFSSKRIFSEHDNLSGEAAWTILNHYCASQKMPDAKPACVTDNKEALKCCSSCKHCTNFGGVPFCDFWHNFTAGNGFCYGYASNVKTP